MTPAGTILHPRPRSVTLPLTYATALFLHVPINFLLVDNLGLGIHGVALGAICTNLNCLLFLAVCSASVHDESIP
ncbi:hypothetical protein E2562_034758 [Oryza meyeriana var. granulata]|uniref:Uncharacterized protein n=1 Tax=Oryza meyeriana var. granulata TaxID=110450 RepID=A0A6G1DU72_9ORYZ|nr:hypothetical protein E2562_037714 [Oryza meyeriana var. granulata]KAF0935575.1 hypothetical protein E2562_034758 [Oryza meyeriana var. granulata]